MKKNILILFAIITILGACAPADRASPIETASGSIVSSEGFTASFVDGCRTKIMNETALGIGFAVASGCEGLSEVRVEGNKVIEGDTYITLEVFQKEKYEAPEAAINRLIISNLSQSARLKCKVVEASVGVPATTVKRFVIKNPDLHLNTNRDYPIIPTDPDCGLYSEGMVPERSYFEFQDQKDTFVFARQGIGWSMVDYDSLKIFR